MLKIAKKRAHSPAILRACQRPDREQVLKIAKMGARPPRNSSRSRRRGQRAPQLLKIKRIGHYPATPGCSRSHDTVWCDRPMRRIYPTCEPVDDEDIVAAYAYPDGHQPYVRANMVASLDGAAWGPDGRSGSLSTPADRRVFHVLRGLADVILAGAATVRTERYGPAAAPERLRSHRASLGQTPSPVIAVVSASLDLDPDAPLFTSAAEPTVVLTTEEAPAERRAALARVTPVVVAGKSSVVMSRALAALAERGYGRVLCEGGPRLLSGLVAADELDELCVTVTPSLQGGSAPRILDGPPVAPRNLELSHILAAEEDGTLMMRWLRQPAPSTDASS